MGAGLIDDFIGNILSVPFYPYHFVQCHFVRIPFCPIPFCPIESCRSVTPKRHRHLRTKDLPRGGPRSLHGGYRAEFEPTTLRTKGDESTNEPPRPTNRRSLHFSSACIYIRYIS